MRKEADDTGPLAELEHWRHLTARLSTIFVLLHAVWLFVFFKCASTALIESLSSLQVQLDFRSAEMSRFQNGH